MSGETTNSSVGREMKVDRNVSNKEIKRLNDMHGYLGVTAAGLAMQVTDGKNVEINDADNNTSASANPRKAKVSNVITIVGNVSKKFDEATIEDIENGVSLKLKGKEKGKGKEETERESDSKTIGDN